MSLNVGLHVIGKMSSKFSKRMLYTCTCTCICTFMFYIKMMEECALTVMQYKHCESEVNIINFNKKSS